MLDSGAAGAEDEVPPEAVSLPLSLLPHAAVMVSADTTAVAAAIFFMVRI
jgi:hypothetical protein